MKCGAPIMVKNPKSKGTEKMLPVRCGKCEGCLKTNINSWAFRLSQEGRIATSVAFITLTYSPEYVPLTPEPNYLPTLSKRDVQLYLKRLRKIDNNTRIKYFAVGEYGTTSMRPHYHIILFNAKSYQSIENAWTNSKNERGHVHIGDNIDSGAIPYTLKYMYKKGLVPAFNGDDRLPEFRIMSKNLGKNYLSEEIKKYHLTDFKNRQYVVNNGFKIAMPRYYREKLIELSGKPRELFRVESDLYPTADDGHYLTVKSRMDAQKAREFKFSLRQNQEQRNKI